SCSKSSAPDRFVRSLHDALPIWSYPVHKLMQVDPRRPFPRRFVPTGATMGEWAQIEPLFTRLRDRSINSADELERWLVDCSELSDRKSTRLNSSHEWISYAVFCL